MDGLLTAQTELKLSSHIAKRKAQRKRVQLARYWQRLEQNYDLFMQWFADAKTATGQVETFTSKDLSFTITILQQAPFTTNIAIDYGAVAPGNIECMFPHTQLLLTLYHDAGMAEVQDRRRPKLTFVEKQHLNVVFHGWIKRAHRARHGFQATLPLSAPNPKTTAQ